MGMQISSAKPPERSISFRDPELQKFVSRAASVRPSGRTFDIECEGPENFYVYVMPDGSEYVEILNHDQGFHLDLKLLKGVVLAGESAVA